jgi:glycosyltransferase involved in cell wall biosynthesis
MKILIIANGYPNQKDPQWGCFEKDQAVALQNLGHEVAMLYVDRRFRTYWRKIGLTRFIDDGIAVFGIFWFPAFSLGKMFPKLYCRWISLMQGIVFKGMLRHWGKPDIIYAHYLYNIAFATELKEKYGIPLVGIEHWSELTKSKLSPLQRFWGETAYGNADKILAVSESLRSHIKRHFGKDSTVVYDMLGQEFVSTPIPKHSLNANFTFVAVGSLVPIKCYDILVEAFKQSGLSQSGCKVVIVGTGQEHDNLKKQIQRAYLQDSVLLTGRKSKEEIISVLAKSHAFILSSRAETFGVACIEALSQGLPCIATRCGGPEEFINERNGLLVPPNDVDSMAAAMQTMYDNYCLYDCAAIAAETRHRFGPQTIAKQLTEIFEETKK